MKYLFILNSGYPTQKAYGVTTKNSIRALLKLGREVELWAPQSEFPNDQSVLIRDTSKYETKLLNRLKNSKSRFVSVVGFKAREIFFPFKLFFKEKNLIEGNILWVRDIPVAFWSAVFGKGITVILEIHHFPRGLQKFMLGRLSNLRNIYLVGITSHHVREIDNIFGPYNPAILCPMAAPDEFFEFNQPKQCSTFSIGYVGKYFSSGNLNGVLEMLAEFGSLVNFFPQATISLIGIEDGEIPTIEKFANSLSIQEFVDVRGHLTGDQLVQEMNKFQVGIVPYPESSYNSWRFPIKIVEYAAMGITLLVSDSVAHRALLSENLAYFYHPEIQGSMEETLIEIFQDLESMQMRTDAAKLWALGFSYEARINPVLQVLNEKNIAN